LMRLEDRFERFELNEVNSRQTNQLIKKLEENFHEEMTDAQGRIFQLEQTTEKLMVKFNVAKEKIVSLEEQNSKVTQELIDAQSTIVAMKLEMNQLNSDLLLLRQSTLDNKRPLNAVVAGIDGHSMIAAEGEVDNFN